MSDKQFLTDKEIQTIKEELRVVLRPEMDGPIENYMVDALAKYVDQVVARYY